jgi:putative ABC transport system permease protein
MLSILKMAYRSLGRNRRRSFFSALALGLGIGLLLMMAALVRGELAGGVDGTIMLQTGDVQVRAQSYNEDKTSLAWKDLIENPSAIAAQVASLAPVKIATPRLYASGIVAASNSSYGVRVLGLDPAAADANYPYTAGLVSGQFLTVGDSSGILIGQTLATKLSLKAGDTINLLVNTSNGDVAQQSFTIRGTYTTGSSGYDQATVLLPLAKAQAIAGAGDHSSLIFILLKDRAQTAPVVAALKSSPYKILTWQEMNDFLLSFEPFANAMFYLLYLIVLGIVATVIVNTLVMAVFERTQEIGILSAIGMKSWRIMSLFFAESAFLAVGGILLGWILGAGLVYYVVKFGFTIGNVGLTGVILSDTIRGQFYLGDAISLTIVALIVTLLAAIYPAILAARLEPVQALHTSK